MPVEIGDVAPDFELKDQTGQPVRLSDYRGKKAVLLVFYPLSFTGACETELCGIRDSIDVFRNDEVETLAISVDSPPAHQRWAHDHGFDFPLLSDFWPHGQVAATYGVFEDALGIAAPASFLVDRDGAVVYSDRNAVPEPRDQDRWRRALEEIGAA